MNIESELLNRHRDGDPKATEELILLLLPLVEEYRRRQRRKIPRRIESEELESVLRLDLCVAVDRLKRNEKRADEVEQYVRNELKHSGERCMRENSEDVLPPKGENEMELIRRVSPIKPSENGDEEQRTNLLETAVQAAVDFDLINREEFEQLLAIAETKLERLVAEIPLSGYDPEKIIGLYGVNEIQVKAILKRLRERATKQAAKSTKSQECPRQVSPQFSESKVTGDRRGDNERACFIGSFDDCHLSPHENLGFSKQTHTPLLISTTPSHVSTAEAARISE